MMPSDHEEAGKLAARVFARFNAGVPPEKVVEEEAVAPDTVLALHDKWLRLKNRSAVVKLEQELPELLEFLPGLIEKVEALEEGLRNDPFFDIRRRFECPHCQSRGHLAVRVKCPECHQWTHVGWPSTEDELSVLEDEETLEKLFPGGPRR